MFDVIDAGNMLLEGRTLFPIVDLTSTVCVMVGESLIEEAIAYFKAKDKSVILFFDQDAYGKKSTIKTAEKLRIAGIKFYIFETDTTIDIQQYLIQ